MSSSEGNYDEIQRKRKRERDYEEKNESPQKRKFLNVKDDYGPNILDLADETLIEILKFTDSESLINLGQTCSRFFTLSKDKQLWSNVSFSKELNIFEIMIRLRYINLSTKMLTLKGNCKKHNYNIPRSLQRKQIFKAIIKKIAERSPLIEELFLSQVSFDWSKEFSMSKFPRNLKVLSFSNCIMPQNRPRQPRAFFGIHEFMPKLQVLKIENCNFFAVNDLMSFSKLPNLTHLSLRGCSKMRSSVPYLSLACRFGFQKLEIFDLRETLINDGELQCLNSIKSLKEIYLEYPTNFDPSDNNSDDEDDLSHFLRRSNTRRVKREPPALTSSINQLDVQNRSNEPTSSILSVNEIDPSSSTFSDFSNSITSSSDENSEEDIPTRTLVIRANINAANDPTQQNAPHIIMSGDDIPQRFLQMETQRRREMISITDRGILGFGIASRGNVVWLGNQDKDKNTYLEKIILRNFSEITDATLLHLESNAPKLIYIDVRGCPKITKEAVERFKAARSNCTLISNYVTDE